MGSMITDLKNIAIAMRGAKNTELAATESKEDKEL